MSPSYVSCSNLMAIGCFFWLFHTLSRLLPIEGESGTAEAKHATHKGFKLAGHVACGGMRQMVIKRIACNHFGVQATWPGRDQLGNLVGRGRLRTTMEAHRSRAPLSTLAIDMCTNASLSDFSLPDCKRSVDIASEGKGQACAKKQ